MTDRELLELAARAAGMGADMWAEVGDLLPGKWGWVQFVGYGHTAIWNPLTDDDHALRLAVKLRICVWVDSFAACCSWCPSGQNPFIEGMQQLAQEIDNDDPYAATRRAIVRAAAEIGKQMKERA